MRPWRPPDARRRRPPPAASLVNYGIPRRGNRPVSKKAAPPTSDPPAGSAATEDPVSRFEASLKELEDIVGRMERGDLPLDESLRLFERGMALARECRGSLETAELRVKNLLEPDGESGAGTDD
ncbi:MAG: exodeoxyribonuclease VII small subunit [Nevskia sp.]|nr:exodeoxyribonuclease VII small subunit [Nevskia sp.]